MRNDGRLAALLALLLPATVPAAQVPPAPPSPPREFRAVWVAAVANIDWPSKPGLTTDEQQQEAIAILDRCQALRLNAVILQVRPQADALYASELEPWSYYLTGRQGLAPEPFYDPLAFWIGAAHARGLELHAWLNPYRANHPAHKGELSERSLVRARPELVVKLGEDGYYWMDPALRGVQDHSHAVVMDIVHRYDVDGIHFDDYFYPYPSYNGDRDFPDDASWEAYRRSGGKLSRADWRRRAVDTFVERVFRGIRKSGRKARFGISPFGIWRPGYPESILGFDQYDKLYADARLWLREGWVDYLTPQLYWPISRIPQSFPVLLRWWLDQNPKRRHVWPGMIHGRGDEEAGALEVVNQIMTTRGMAAPDPGHALFSMKALFKDVLTSRLAGGPYAAPALVPRSPWIDKKPPKPPALTARRVEGRVEASWTEQGSEKAFVWVVHTLQAGRWSYEILPGATTSMGRDVGGTLVEGLAVSAVDRNGNESRPARCAFVAAPAGGPSGEERCPGGSD